MLSFFSIFGIQNNFVNLKFSYQYVVNCFHFSVSLGYKTTFTFFIISSFKLWIAFIFQYLWDTKQLIIGFTVFAFGCELLSFFSIFGIQNNGQLPESKEKYVVNCFHFSVSLGYKTTRMVYYCLWSWLWIAFIFQYLWDTKQLLVANV